MIPYDEKGDFVCVRLEPHDWELYRDIRLAYLRDSNSSITHEMEATAQEWREGLAEMGTFFTVLTRGEPVSSLCIYSDEEEPYPEMTNLYTVSDFRGQHLPDMLFRAAKRYLAEETTHQKCTVNVLPQSSNHKDAFRIATRNGFVHTGKVEPYGDQEFYDHFELDVEALRAEP